MTMSVLGCHGYEHTLQTMKDELGDVLGWKQASEVPSVSAFCQARSKLTKERCAQVVSQVYALCVSARQVASLTFGQFRLLAIDGTRLGLPAYAAMVKHFGCPSQGEGKELSCPQASFTVLWDVGANQPVDWRLGPYRTSEQVHGDELLASTGIDDLVLADRNFPSRRMLTLLHQCQASLLARVRSEGIILRQVQEFRDGTLDDAIVELDTADEQGRPLPAHPTIRIRLLRARLPDGSTAFYLTTLLDQERYPAVTLIALYTQRWRIETAFREAKVWHGLERFHARSPEGIAQEITAIMIFLLLTSELEAQARLEEASAQVPPVAPDDHRVQVRTPTIRFNRRIVADCTLSLLYTAVRGGDLKHAFDDAFYRIWRYRQKPKAGRSFPRRRKSAPRGWKPRGTKGKGRKKRKQRSRPLQSV
jgi:hypothetical protein